jgi:uncharacterized membrane protein YdbT with pleckstrin-like domain
MDETIHYQGHPSWRAFWGPLLLSGVFLLLLLDTKRLFLCLAISTTFFLIAVISRFRRDYTITDMRVIMRIGLISNNTSEIELQHIRGMNVRQNILERLLGIGTVLIISSADDTIEVVFEGISNPVRIKDMIRSISREIPYES